LQTHYLPCRLSTSNSLQPTTMFDSYQTNHTELSPLVATEGRELELEEEWPSKKRERSFVAVGTALLVAVAFFTGKATSQRRTEATLTELSLVGARTASSLTTTSSPTCMDPPLKDIGKNPVLPLDLCEGDCGSDDECMGSLVCFKRTGYTPVPGCCGSGNGSRDYCIIPLTPEPTPAPIPAPPTPTSTQAPTLPTTSDPTPAPTPASTPVPEPTLSRPYIPYPKLKNIGQDPGFPLDLCEGDCDYDYECIGSLVCYHREYDPGFPHPIPGCSGYGFKAYDYCIQPPLRNNERDPVLDLCEGDCDSDDECIGSLVCFHKDEHYELVPGCHGWGVSGVRNYCIIPPLINNITPILPLDLCEGDCDYDDECMGSLECFQRTGFTHVPGCYGAGVSGSDYCITPLVYVHNPNKDTWANHEATAVICGGHLASARTANEMSEIVIDTWTGAYQKQPCDSEPFGCWHWSGGRAFQDPYCLWNIGEPNEYKELNEDCGVWKGSGLNDLPCDRLAGGTYLLPPDYDVHCM